MNKIYKSFSIAALALASTAAFAQNTESAYFVDGSLYRHELNPAIGNEAGYLSMPILGNLNVSVNGTLGLQNLIYNRGGKTVTFLHPDVSSAEFMSGIKDQNKLGEELRLQILSVGFKGMGGYNTVGVSIREKANFMLPGTVFDLAKNGLENATYDLSNLGFHADAYAEVALGHSRKIGNLRVGAKIKALLGIANVDGDVNAANVTLGADGKYVANVDATVQTSMKGLTYTKDNDKNTVDGADFDSNQIGIGGMGLALDLGAEYKINDTWKVSASVLDLGFINWKNNLKAQAQGTNTLDLNTFSYNVDDDIYADNQGRELGDALEDFADVFQLQDKGDEGGRTTSLGMTVNAGVEYSLPVYKRLKVGLLGTARMQGDYSWTNVRLSANIAPVNFFSAGVNVSTGTYGTGFGCIADIHTHGFALYVAMDKMLGKLAKPGVPLDSNAEFTVGLNFPF